MGVGVTWLVKRITEQVAIVATMTKKGRFSYLHACMFWTMWPPNLKCGSNVSSPYPIVRDHVTQSLSYLNMCMETMATDVITQKSKYMKYFMVIMVYHIWGMVRNSKMMKFYYCVSANTMVCSVARLWYQQRLANLDLITILFPWRQACKDLSFKCHVSRYTNIQRCGGLKIFLWWFQTANS